MTLRNKTFGVLLAGASLLSATSAFAGGPLAVCTDGEPFRWSNGGVGITFNPDQGGLGPLTNADATDAVAFSFEQWTNIATSTATYVEGAALPVDVDIDTFGPYLNPVAPDGLSAIVYDDTGEIFDVLFGTGSGILGFAGPEWVNFGTCEITEGLSFLNGPAFTDLTAAIDVMVHEFGHFSNLAHVQINGALVLGDSTGPDADVYPFPDLTSDIIETMYPFYFGPLAGTQTVEKDDIISLSTLYPTDDFVSGSLTIEGSVRIPDGATRISGVNVIARNVADPFADATGILSGANTDLSDPDSSDFVGTFSISGLTPGAEYQVYIDEIVDGGFSTPPVDLGPSPEEFYSGAAESNNDDPLLAVNLSGAAGDTVSGVDIILNQLQPGDPIDTGIFGDGFTEVFSPFPLYFCGEKYDSFFINGNGSVTFGAGSGDFSPSTGDLLFGLPRVAGHWQDLNSSLGGIVTFDTDGSTFIEAIWNDVPEFGVDPAESSNTFSIRFENTSERLGKKFGNSFRIDRGDLSAQAGVTGFSCGGNVNRGFEKERNLDLRRSEFFAFRSAIYEEFVGFEGDQNDMSGLDTRVFGTGSQRDKYERHLGDGSLPKLTKNNNTIEKAFPIEVPFANTRRYTEISEGDIDYFSFPLPAGEIAAIEIVRGQLDTVIGIFDGDTGDLLLVDDDGGDGLLSRAIFSLFQDTNVVVAVTTFGDTEFTGEGTGTGSYLLSVNTYQGTPVFLGDDDSAEIPLPNGFTFQGEDYDSVNLNSNGNLTFLAGDPFGFSESVDQLLNGPPRIATFWDDLDPSGFFGNPGLYIVGSDGESTTISGVSVSEFFSTSPNYFSAKLAADGEIEFNYGITARNDSLIGISEGGGAEDPGPIKLASPKPKEALGTLYENFPNGFGAETKVTPFSDFDLIKGGTKFDAPDTDL